MPISLRNFIHDINLVTDLTQHDPNDPYPCDGTDSGSTPPEGINRGFSSTGGLSFSDVWLSSFQSIEAIWELVSGYWPVLMFIFVVGSGEVSNRAKIGVDLLSQKYLEELSFVDDQTNPTTSGSYEESHLDYFLGFFITMGILALIPLLQTCETLIRGGITNLTPAQVILIATTFALAFLIGYISWWDIESDLYEGEIDHGDAAFAYQMLTITVVGAILGREKLEGFINNVIMDILVFIGAQSAGFGWNGNSKNGACQHIGLMLIIMLALLTFFFSMWYFHFCVYYGLLVI